MNALSDHSGLLPNHVDHGPALFIVFSVLRISITLNITKF